LKIQTAWSLDAPMTDISDLPIKPFTMHAKTQSKNKRQGGHKVGEKIPEFSRLFKSHKLTFL